MSTKLERYIFDVFDHKGKLRGRASQVRFSDGTTRVLTAGHIADLNKDGPLELINSVGQKTTIPTGSFKRWSNPGKFPEIDGADCIIKARGGLSPARKLDPHQEMHILTSPRHPQKRSPRISLETATFNGHEVENLPHSVKLKRALGLAFNIKSTEGEISPGDSGTPIISHDLRFVGTLVESLPRQSPLHNLLKQIGFEDVRAIPASFAPLKKNRRRTTPSGS